MRIALAYNQSLRANRLNIDQSKANEITAGLKPNPTLSLSCRCPSDFSAPNHPLRYSNLLGWTQLHGGKEAASGKSAWWWRKTTPRSAAQTVTDNERTLRFQVVQAFINVLLAKSVLLLAKDDLANFSQEVELNHARLVAGDLAEGDYLKLSIQKLQFEQDVSAAVLGLVQARVDTAATTGLPIGDRRFRRNGNAGSHQALRHAGRISRRRRSSRGRICRPRIPA